MIQDKDQICSNDGWNSTQIIEFEWVWNGMEEVRSNNKYIMFQIDCP